MTDDRGPVVVAWRCPKCGLLSERQPDCNECPNCSGADAHTVVETTPLIDRREYDELYKLETKALAVVGQLTKKLTALRGELNKLKELQILCGWCDEHKPLGTSLCLDCQIKLGEERATNDKLRAGVQYIIDFYFHNVGAIRKKLGDLLRDGDS